MHILETINIEYRYPNGTTALRGINLKIRKGSKVAVLGPNAAGKSTLLYLFNGTLRPTLGTVLLNGTPMQYDTESLREIRRIVGMVFQNPDDQLFAPTVKQDVSFGPINLKLSREEVEKRVSESLKLVGLAGLEKIPPHYLSGGQKKRAAIAGILAMDPQILIFDEPLTGLDPRGQADMIELLDQFNAEGKTIIVTTHRMDFAADWADEIWVMKNGLVMKNGTPDEIFTDNSLIQESNLQVPVPIQTHNELLFRGFDHGQIPLSVLELVESVTAFFDKKEYKDRLALAKNDFDPFDDCYIGFNDGVLVASRENFENSYARCRCQNEAKEGEQVWVDLSAISTGIIWIIRTPRASEAGIDDIPASEVQRLIDSKKPDRIGAMGTMAKSIVQNAGLRYDFGTDVVHSAVSAALRGLSTLIFATGGMAGLAAEKISSLNRRTNKEIQFQLISDLTFKDN